MESKELLQQVEKAIKTITVTGQSYKLGSRSVTRADLAELREMRKELMQEIAAMANTTDGLSGFHMAEFEGR